MKFLYCRECNNLRPRGWIIFTKRCETCHNEMEKFGVKMTVVAPFYYASVVALMIALIMYLTDMEIPLGITAVIILLVLTMILAFIDYNSSYIQAKKIIAKKAEGKKA